MNPCNNSNVLYRLMEHFFITAQRCSREEIHEFQNLNTYDRFMQYYPKTEYAQFHFHTEPRDLTCEVVQPEIHCEPDGFIEPPYRKREPLYRKQEPLCRKQEPRYRKRNPQYYRKNRLYCLQDPLYNKHTDQYISENSTQLNSNIVVDFNCPRWNNVFQSILDLYKFDKKVVSDDLRENIKYMCKDIGCNRINIYSLEDLKDRYSFCHDLQEFFTFLKEKESKIQWKKEIKT